MRILFKICICLSVTWSINLFAQDTTVYKREYENRHVDTCSNKIVHQWVGCGHPDHILQLCDGHTFEKLQVFDRWGYLVYVSTDQRDRIVLRYEYGTFLGENVYMFVLKYKTRSGELKTSTGQFTYIP